MTLVPVGNKWVVMDAGRCLKVGTFGECHDYFRINGGESCE